MRYTDKFLRLPIQVYDRRHKELTGDEVSKDSYLMVDPFQIAAYRPTWDDGDENQEEIVSMSLKNGDTYQVYLPVAEFEAKLNHFGAK